MIDRTPIAALAGHFDWVKPSGFEPTLAKLTSKRCPSCKLFRAYPTGFRVHGGPVLATCNGCQQGRRGQPRDHMPSGKADS